MARLILVVDDDKTLRGVLREALSEQGYQVLEGANGEEGVALALEYKPDLVISDIVMPELDGWDFCQTLRSMPKTKGTPFIFLSSLDQAPEKVLGLRLGADAFLTKPFNALEMLNVVGELLGRMEGRDQVVRGEARLSAGDKTANIIVDTIEFLRSTGRDGVLSVQAGPKEGLVSLAKGKVRHASFDGEDGESALVAMLRCGESRVSFREEGPELPANVEMTWQDFMASIADRRAN